MASQRTAEGAAAFTSYWFEMANWASASNDGATLESLSASDCEYCDLVIKGAEETAAAGGTLDGGRTSVSNVAYSHTLPDESLVLNLTYAEEAGKVLLPDGAVQHSWEAVAPAARQVVVIWGDAGWQMAGFGSEVVCADC